MSDFDNRLQIIRSHTLNNLYGKPASIDLQDKALLLDYIGMLENLIVKYCKPENTSCGYDYNRINEIIKRRNGK